MKIENLPQSFRTYLEQINFPVIIEFHDEYRFMYYASNDNEMGKVFLKVLKDRLDWFYKDKLSESSLLTMEEIDKLPEYYKVDALEKRKKFLKRDKEVNENNRILKLAHEAAIEECGAKAWECIDSKSNEEYGNFEIISIKDIRI